MSRIPRHVAIIMDGNGRWATERGLPRVAGHRAGVDAVHEVVSASLDTGIEILTLYVFSQENWKRPKEEVSVLMSLLDIFLKEQVKKLLQKGVRLQTIGRIEALPRQTLEMLKSAVAATAGNDKLFLNVAINYGGRTEILDAVGRIVEESKTDPAWANGTKKLDEETFSKYLYTAGQPDPDLLIRTSGEMRLSNFLLWQLSYSEFYITKKYWPDFGRADFEKALEEYAQRERRFGDVHAA
jgi:undecaprenyl diphosphate synthase